MYILFHWSCPPFFRNPFTSVFFCGTIVKVCRGGGGTRQNMEVTMAYRYRTRGTCSVFIDVEMNGDVLENVVFTGGCSGNLQALSRLVKGMTADEIKAKVDGIRCGYKSTSCADQMCRAIELAMAENAAKAGN